MKYVKKRYLSLFPHYIVAIAVYYFIGKGYSLLSTAKGNVKISLIGIILNVLGFNGFSITYINSVVPGGWYIGTVWLYFLMAPFIFKVVNNASKAVNCVFAALICRVGFHFLCGRVVLDPLLNDWADMCILNQFSFIAIGQFLFFVIIKKDIRLSRLSQLALIMSIMYVTIQKDILTLWALVFAIIILVLSKTGRSILINRCMLLFGKYSLEIYLLHNAVLFYLCKMKWNIQNSYILILALLIITSALSLGLGVVMNKCINSAKLIIKRYCGM